MGRVLIEQFDPYPRDQLCEVNALIRIRQVKDLRASHYRTGAGAKLAGLFRQYAQVLLANDHWANVTL